MSGTDDAFTEIYTVTNTLSLHDALPINVAVVPEDEMVSSLVEWAEFIHEHGVERALAKADLRAAKAAADADRDALLAEQGDDANASEERVELIRSRQ